MENTDYQPISCSFYDVLEATATQKIYSKIQYFTDLHEFITVNALIKTFVVENKVEYMILATDEKIRLDKIVKINDTYSPKYQHIEDFTCDC